MFEIGDLIKIKGENTYWFIIPNDIFVYPIEIQALFKSFRNKDFGWWPHTGESRMKVGDLVQMKTIRTSQHITAGRFTYLGFITRIVKEGVWIQWFKDCYGKSYGEAILYSEDYCRSMGIHKVL